mmetsp:Transcript_15015/g.58866  ORF Transcript_15015/g.58866 Transcript_15015/m.58866 type:complete len:224 (+) Transcript_15015:1151-1822(+)
MRRAICLQSALSMRIALSMTAASQPFTGSSAAAQAATSWRPMLLAPACASPVLLTSAASGGGFIVEAVASWPSPFSRRYAQNAVTAAVLSAKEGERKARVRRRCSVGWGVLSPAISMRCIANCVRASALLLITCASVAMAALRMSGELMRLRPSVVSWSSTPHCTSTFCVAAVLGFVPERRHWRISSVARIAAFFCSDSAPHSSALLTSSCGRSSGMHDVSRK